MTDRPTTTTPMALLFVADQLPWLAHRPEAEAAFDELDQLLPLLLAVIDTPAPTTYVGPCDVCRRDMYAKVGAPEVKCAPCDLVYDVGPRREWLLELVVDQLATATEVSRALASWGTAVTPDRIRMWAMRERGKESPRLITRGQDLRGRPLYRVGDVLDVLNTPTSGRIT